MNKYYLYLCLAILVISCDSPSEESKYQESDGVLSTPEKEIVLEDRLSTWINYEGELPCEDCTVIQTQLKLENSPDQKERAFELTETYKNTTDGDRKFTTSGIYEVIYGLENDPGAMAIRLYDDSQNLIKTFKQEKGGSLLLLSAEETPIASEGNYSLIQREENE